MSEEEADLYYGKDMNRSAQKKSLADDDQLNLIIYYVIQPF